MKLVFNPSLTDSVVYGDEGQMVAPGEWAYLDDDTYPNVTKFLNTGKLVRVEIPKSMPSSVAPGAAEALKQAVEDRDSKVPDDAPLEDADDETEPQKPSVRNTGRKRTNTQNKEA